MGATHPTHLVLVLLILTTTFHSLFIHTLKLKKRLKQHVSISLVVAVVVVVLVVQCVGVVFIFLWPARLLVPPRSRGLQHLLRLLRELGVLGVHGLLRQGLQHLVQDGDQLVPVLLRHNGGALCEDLAQHRGYLGQVRVVLAHHPGVPGLQQAAQLSVRDLGLRLVRLDRQLREPEGHQARRVHNAGRVDRRTLKLAKLAERRHGVLGGHLVVRGPGLRMLNDLHQLAQSVLTDGRKVLAVDLGTGSQPVCGALPDVSILARGVVQEDRDE
mmetsp:Transcript_120/g.496  ORF Transcript_120/g.496 Transcript_120/m.496 type:complete len:271 (+) Transcript_120:418-1230(+)